MNTTAVAFFALLTPLQLAAQDSKAGDKGTPLDLKVTAKKNDVAFFKITTRMEQSVDMGGQLMDMGNETVHTAEIKVVDVDDKGVLTVEFKVHTVRGTMTLPMMGDLEFDSTAKAEAAAAEGDAGGMMPNMDGIKQAMTLQTGKILKARIAPNGEAIELIGVKELIAEAQKKAGRMGGQMLTGSLNESAFKRLIQGCFGSLPKEPTAVGGTWRRQNSQSANRGAQVVSDLNLKLDRADAERVAVAITGTLATPPRKEQGKGEDAGGKKKAESEEEDPAAAQQRAMMEQLKIENGKVKGLEEIARKDGMVLKATGEMAMDLTLPSPMGAGEMKIHQTTTSLVERTTAAAMTAAPTPKPPADKK